MVPSPPLSSSSNFRKETSSCCFSWAVLVLVYSSCSRVDVIVRTFWRRHGDQPNSLLSDSLHHLFISTSQRRGALHTHTHSPCPLARFIPLYAKFRLTNQQIVDQCLSLPCPVVPYTSPVVYRAVAAVQCNVPLLLRLGSIKRICCCTPL